MIPKIHYNPQTSPKSIDKWLKTTQIRDKQRRAFISLRTGEHDEQPLSRTKHLYGAFFLDITGFFAFSVVGCPIP
jgi:hypothetical protein